MSLGKVCHAVELEVVLRHIARIHRRAKTFLVITAIDPARGEAVAVRRPMVVEHAFGRMQDFVLLNAKGFELEARGIIVHRSSVGRMLHRLGLSHKKSLMASEQLRPEIARARSLWIERRKPFFDKALARLTFIDETSTNTKLTKRSGWLPKSQRYRSHAPFGSWKTQTFIAGLRSHSMVAPWIVNAPMNAEIFETWIETRLVPTLSKGDVVIADNVRFHKSEKAESLIRQKGAWLLFLPAYSPDLNPIEMAFSKLKTLLRKKAARSFDAISNALGDICALFSVEECRNYFNAAGYEAN
jgi:transposase